jgi:hypothetical protein
MIPQLKTMLKEKHKDNDTLSRKLEEKLKTMAELTERLKKKYDSMQAESLPYRHTYTVTN